MTYYDSLKAKALELFNEYGCSVEAAMNAADYNSTDAKRLVSERPELNDKLYGDYDYPYNATESEIIITNVQIEIQEYLDNL